MLQFSQFQTGSGTLNQPRSRIKGTMNRLSTAMSVLALLLVNTFANSTPTQANTPLTINSTADEVDATPGDGLCVSAPSGLCTLRAAIMEANALAGGDQLLLPAGVYTLTIPGINEEAGRQGDLDLTSNLGINALGPVPPVIDGNALDRVLHIHSAAVVTISQVVIQNGALLSNQGGGILNQGRLTLSDSVVSHNTAEFGGGLMNYHGGTLVIASTIISENLAEGGGGIGNYDLITMTSSSILSNTATDGAGGINNNNYTNGNMTLITTRIQGNVSSSNSGGIFNGATMTLLMSSVLENRAGDSQTPGVGGGITNLGALTVTQSVIGNNVASLEGGGLYTWDTEVLPDQDGLLTIVNSTLSGNHANESGGGMYVVTGTVNLRNVTIADNIADYDSNLSGTGGGLYVYSNYSPTVNLQNTLIADNDDLMAEGRDCFGILYSTGYNLIQDPTGCDLQGDGTGNLVGLPAGLDVLRHNGGPCVGASPCAPTLTHALLPNSPAIDAGQTVACTDALGDVLRGDQRDFPRPFDGNGDNAPICDIGAYELWVPTQWAYLALLFR